MSELYFIQRADACVHLAYDEDDLELKAMLFDLAHIYREQAHRAMAPYRAH